jgi:signal transduction histidine kinase/CheY-like chemotaxis protein
VPKVSRRRAPAADECNGTGYDTHSIAGAIAATACQPFLILDGECIVLAGSQPFYQTFDLRPDQTVGRSVFEIGNGMWDIPELRGALSKKAMESGVVRRLAVNMRSAMASQPLGIHISNTSDNGNSRLVFAAIEALSDPSYGGPGEVHDSSPEIDPALYRQHDPKLNGKCSSTGIVFADAESLCVSIDFEAASICGVTRDEAWGDGWLRHAVSEDVLLLQIKLAQARETKSATSVRVRFTPPAGPTKIALITVIPTVTLFSGYVFTLHDITRQKELEARLAEAQKMEAIGHLAGGVAHDFNNVLAAIASFTSQMLSELPPSSAASKSAAQVNKLVGQAALIAGQLLESSRKRAIRPEPLNLNDILRDMRDMMLNTVGSPIELRLALDPGIGSVKADLGQMRQVILNLVVNSRDAMLRGGTLSISTANVDLKADNGFRSAPPGTYVVLEVSDTGTGMGAATREQIFDPFFTTKPGGTGLGLPMVYGIVQQYGGFIRVESEPGHGTRFRLFLPRAEEPLETAGLRGGDETILLVEDAGPVRSLMRELLEERGYKIIEAYHAEQALDLIERGEAEIHLLITDLMLPKMNGYELSRRVRVRFPETKVIFMTGHIGELFRSTGYDASFLGKPFQPEALIALTRKVLDCRRAT